MLQGFRKIFFRYKAQDDGTTAIEFSLVAMPFILLTVGILEISLFFVGTTVFESAVNDAARLVKTGQIQKSGGAEETFRTALCESLPVLVNCADVVFEVVPVGSGSFFNVSELPALFDADGAFESRGFDAGGVNDVMLVRAVYEYPLITPLIGQLMTAGDNTMMIMSTVIFQTEPYEFTGV